MAELNIPIVCNVFFFSSFLKSWHSLMKYSLLLTIRGISKYQQCTRQADLLSKTAVCPLLSKRSCIQYSRIVPCLQSTIQRTLRAGRSRVLSPSGKRSIQKTGSGRRTHLTCDGSTPRRWHFHEIKVCFH